MRGLFEWKFNYFSERRIFNLVEIICDDFPTILSMQWSEKLLHACKYVLDYFSFIRNPIPVARNSSQENSELRIGLWGTVEWTDLFPSLLLYPSFSVFLWLPPPPPPYPNTPYPLPYNLLPSRHRGSNPPRNQSLL